jgi:hypothetical protein
VPPAPPLTRVLRAPRCGSRPAQARDAYFACADASGERACWRVRRAYAAACPAAWVKHFDKKREERSRVAAAVQLQAQPRYTGPPPPGEQQQGAPKGSA